MDKLERIRGSLLAGAVGDALGYAVEFDSGKAIRKLVGNEGVRHYLDLRGNPPAAPISDDTQMTLFTAEGMLRAKAQGLDFTFGVYEAYLDWLDTQQRKETGSRYHPESYLMAQQGLFALRAPGNTCLSALRSGKIGSTMQPINQSKGCGGVMRTAPCGMMALMPADAPEDAYALQGAEAAAITHGHPLGWLPGAMLADMVHLCLTEQCDSLREVAEVSLARVMNLWGDSMEAEAFSALMEKAFDLVDGTLPDERAIGILGEGWVGDEALAIAVYCCLKHPDHMTDCLSAAVTHKGDSDSTGAVAGNILGAWLGAGAIDEEHLAQLELRDVIEEMARRIAAAE